MNCCLLFLYLIEQVEFSQLLADVDLLYFQRAEVPNEKNFNIDLSLLATIN